MLTRIFYRVELFRNVLHILRDNCQERCVRFWKSDDDFINYLQLDLSICIYNSVTAARTWLLQLKLCLCSGQYKMPYLCTIFNWMQLFWTSYFEI